MGPIGSKVIKYRGQRSNLFFFLFPPRSLGRSSPNLEGMWRAAPDISLRGSFFERSRSSRTKVKFMGGFSVCSPASPGSFIFLKVKVIEVKGQIYGFFFSV